MSDSEQWTVVRDPRECRWCGGALVDEPYLQWLFFRCAYCDREMLRHHDAHYTPGVPP